MLDRGDYWQCAYVIPKGGIERIKSRGLEAFRGLVVEMSPFLADRVGDLKSWDDIRLLSLEGRKPIFPRWSARLSSVEADEYERLSLGGDLGLKSL